MKSILFKLKNYLFLAAMMFTLNFHKVYAVSFNEAKAKADIQGVLNPMSNVFLFIATPLAALSIGGSYVGYMMKDDEEKESMPFTKTVKKQVIAFVFFLMSGAILKWFSI